MGKLADLLPMPLLHARIAEHSDQRAELQVVFYLACHPFEHLQWAFNLRVLLIFFITSHSCAAVESINKLDRLGVHLLNLFFDQFRI